MRIVLASVVALVASVVLLHGSTGSRGAVRSDQPSVNVAVVPGFRPAPYPGYIGIPKLPVTDPQLSSFHFTEVPAAQVTTAGLQQFDTVLLYGIRWSDLSATAQQAIDTFAATGKVVIWDADDTGSQNYATFVHPFSSDASGENGKANDSVVSFPSGDNFLASSNPSSPYYLDPNQLVTDRNMINDMSAMRTGTSGWTPALIGANKNIPQGGWVVAWAYGDVGNHTGLAVYSGIDADAFTDQLTPNYAVTELKLDLAAPFLRTPDTSCAPSCTKPPTTGGTPFAACSFAKPLPRGWVHGRVPIVLKTSVATGITGSITTPSGKALVSGRENTSGLIPLRVRTTRLRSNRAARLLAVVRLNGQQACSMGFRLRVDNVRPRLLLLATSRSGGRDLVKLRVSERSTVAVYYGRGVRWRRPTTVRARRRAVFRLPGRAASATIIVSDRAGNRLVRHVHW